MLIVGGLLLALADGVRGKRTIDEVGLRTRWLMGVGQAIALQPGVSRSGVTITVGRFVGLGRDGAARFAFLMSLPITAGAAAVQVVRRAGRRRHPGRTCGRRSSGASSRRASPATSPCGARSS